MRTHGDVLELIRQANPLPECDRLDPDEASAGIAAIEAAWQQDTQGSPPRSRSRWPGFLGIRNVRAMVATATITVILIGGPVILLQLRETAVEEGTATTIPTTVTTTPVTTGPPSPTTTIAPRIVVQMPGLTSTQTAPSAGLEDEFIEIVIVGGPGFIAVGTTQVCETTDGVFRCINNGAVWVSPDGFVWDKIDDPTVFTPSDTAWGGQGNFQWINDVTAGPLGVVAVGSDGSERAVWVSLDGLDWSRITSEELGDSNGSLKAVAYGGPGYVAVGSGVWVSEDGMTWTRVEDPDLDTGREPAEIWTLAATSSGFLAAGDIGFDEGMEGQGTGNRPALWFSADGLDWERLPDSTLERYGIDRLSTHLPMAVRGSNTEFLIVGEGWEEGMGMWTSVDGRAWDEVDVSYMGSSQETGSVDHIGTHWDGSRWVSVGFEESTGTVWVSFELGVPWQPVGRIELGDIPYDITGVTATESQLVITLATWENRGRDRIFIWTGTWNE